MGGGHFVRFQQKTNILGLFIQRCDIVYSVIFPIGCGCCPPNGPFLQIPEVGNNIKMPAEFQEL